MILQTRHIDVLALVLLGALVGLGAFFIYTLHADTRQKNQLRHELLIKQLHDLDTAQTSVDTLRGVLGGQKARLIELNQRIPGTAGIGILLTEIHKLIQERSVSMTQFNHEPPVRIGNYHRIPLHITLEGRFLDIYQIIHAFETLNRLFIIDSVQMAQPDGQAFCQTELTASIFFD